MVAGFRVHATPVYDEHRTLHGAVAVFHDITETINISRQRDAISALITHDLKNHLCAESRLLQFLIDGKLGPLTDEQKDMLISIDRDSKRHLQMTNTLVEIFRYDVQADAANLSDSDITTLIEDCKDSLLPSTQTSGLVLETDYEDRLPTVQADIRALRHVLMNLLGNAVKFTPKGGHIKIETRNLDNEISVSVSDTGPGIPEADLQLLFAVAWTKSSHHQKPEGTGLGLYLCARIIAAHHGRITCSSQPGVGTTFTIFLPKVVAKV